MQLDLNIKQENTLHCYFYFERMDRGRSFQRDREKQALSGVKFNPTVTITLVIVKARRTKQGVIVFFFLLLNSDINNVQYCHQEHNYSEPSLHQSSALSFHQSSAQSVL